MLIHSGIIARTTSRARAAGLILVPTRTSISDIAVKPPSSCILHSNQHVIVTTISSLENAEGWTGVELVWKLQTIPLPPLGNNGIRFETQRLIAINGRCAAMNHLEVVTANPFACCKQFTLAFSYESRDSSGIVCTISTAASYSFPSDNTKFDSASP